MAWKYVQRNDETGTYRTTDQGGGGGGSSTLSGLEDVDLNNLQDGQIIKWDATNQKFVNANESGGSSGISLTKIDTYTLHPSLVSGTNNTIKTIPANTLSVGIYNIGVVENYNRERNRSWLQVSGSSGKVLFPATDGSSITDVQYDYNGWSTFTRNILVQVLDASTTLSFSLWGNGYSPNSVVISVYKYT